jgi:hypothetical protein
VSPLTLFSHAKSAGPKPREAHLLLPFASGITHRQCLASSLLSDPSFQWQPLWACRPLTGLTKLHRGI